MSEQWKERLEALKRAIRDHDYCYYVLNDPRVPDAEYDALYEELKHIESEHPESRTPDSPTQRVGGMAADHFSQYTHGVPMVSLDNAFDEAALTAFDKRLQERLGGGTVAQLGYIAEPKLDGVAINLLYEQGVLTLAATRGDGKLGEVVTASVRTIPSIPLKLRGTHWPERVEIRGEIIMHREVFEQLNADAIENGGKTFMNPRNAAAGSIRQLDPQIVASRRLDFFAFGIGETKGKQLWSTQQVLLQQLQDWGMPINAELTEPVSGVSGCMSYYRKVEQKRARLPYDIDGVVYKLNDRAQQELAGATARAPRWAIAYKFPQKSIITSVEAIHFQVGRTGVLTPVATLSPVLVGGVTVRHATLHNISEMARKDVRVGDSVWVRRAGDVIPEVVAVQKELRPAEAQTVAVPTQCPVCQAPVVQVEDSVALRCSNKMMCSAQLQAMVEHFVSRKAMDIEGVGRVLIAQCIAEGWITRVSDLYALTEAQLTSLPRMGKLSARNVLSALENSRETTLPRLLFSWGIHGVGEQTAYHLATHFEYLQEILEADVEALQAIEYIGPVAAQHIVDFFQDPESHRLLDTLRAAGVHWPEPFSARLPQKNNAPLAGKTIVVTGRFAHMSRTQIQEALRALGGRIGSQVTARTDYLLAGEAPGKKIQEARQYKVPVVDEAQLMLWLAL